MDFVKKNKTVLLGVLVLALVLMYYFSANSVEGYSSFYIPPMGSVRKNVPNVSIDISEPNASTPENTYGSVGPFYELNGVKMENPDVERIKALDHTCNKNSDLPTFTTPAFNGFDETETYAGFHPTMQPNGLNSEISELYAKDVMPTDKPVYYNQNNIMRTGDSIRALVK